MSYITPQGAMCQICFDFKLKADLYKDDAGDLWDICIDCYGTDLIGIVGQHLDLHRWENEGGYTSR